MGLSIITHSFQKWAAQLMVWKGCPSQKIVIGVCVDAIAYKKQEAPEFTTHMVCLVGHLLLNI